MKMNDAMFSCRRLINILPACLSALLLICSSCNSRYGDVEGDAVGMLHSSLLEITECDGYTVADIKNPWGKGLLRRYLLVPKGRELPSGLPAGDLLRVPLENCIVFSGVHAALLDELGTASAISGVCDRQYIYSSAVNAGLEKGTIADCGSSLNVDAEAVAQVSPDAIFVLPFENGGYGKLDKMPFPLVECADYMESSPLGCAEWVRFYGRLLGKAQKSDSIFNVVCKEYEAIRSIVATAENRPKLMCELKSSSAWYVPGGNSTMGRMYNDAGAEYLFSGFGANGSLPLSYEVVLDKASEADIWLFKYNSENDKTRSSLLAEFDGYCHFKPFETGNVHACNTRRNNLFEEASFHPERLLKELAALFHPSLFPEYKPFYYEKIE